VRLIAAVVVLAGAAAGYVGARRLLSREQLPEQVPAPLRAPLEQLRSRLEVARLRAAAIIEEADRERRAAEAEMMRDYHQRVGRPQDAPPPPSRN
jgi:hypothetical protein